MIKFLLYLIRPVTPRAEDPARKAQWLRDPLSHPAIACMDQRELGDLPFRR